ncbi:ATP-binding cassette domain-containing protein [Kineosporia corallincola]|nr:ABC transporter ATP-binding protein [Kineosporia corallincola]
MDDADLIDLALREGRALDVVEGLPRKLETPLGRSYDDGVQLSGGQWQRLALARARMRQAPLMLLLDEPAAAIDPLAEEEILRGYLAAARSTARAAGGITLFASHRLSTAKEADLIVVVSGGKIAETGHHDTLIDLENGIYQRLFGMQAEAYGPAPVGGRGGDA